MSGEMYMLLRNSLVILLLVFCVGFHSASAEEPQRQVKIGLITDLSNDGAPVGKQSQAGVKFAEEFLKSQGKDVTVIVGDHKIDTKVALAEAHRMLHASRVDAIISDTTPTSFAISPVVLSAKRLMVYVSPVASLTEANPYAFRSFVDYVEGCKRLGELFKRMGKTKVGLLKINFEFSEDCHDGLSVVYPDAYILSYNKGEDMRLLTLRLKQNNVEAVLQMGYEADFVNRARAAKELRFDSPVGIPSVWFTDALLAEAAGTKVSYYGFGFSEVSSEFVRQLKEKPYYAGQVNIEVAATAYQSVIHLFNAISECPHKDIQCQAAALERQKSLGVIGFDGWQNRLAQYSMRYRKWSDGVFTDLP